MHQIHEYKEAFGSPGSSNSHDVLVDKKDVINVETEDNFLLSFQILSVNLIIFKWSSEGHERELALVRKCQLIFFSFGPAY